jgi:hypothetical protein
VQQQQQQQQSGEHNSVHIAQKTCYKGRERGREENGAAHLKKMGKKRARSSDDVVGGGKR